MSRIGLDLAEISEKSSKAPMFADILAHILVTASKIVVTDQGEIWCKGVC